LIRSRELLQLLKQQIISYDRYESGDLRVIGYPGFSNSDVVVRDRMSYSKWLESYQSYPIIKVEGLEDVIKGFKSVHLFYNQKSRRSFKWHTDPVNVQLHVLKGTKFLQVRNKNYKLVAGQSAIIPKNHLHRAYSTADTWALSVEL
jgi:mannose-6-phosphate isomerase-like protein (cupin superfamily)